MQTPQKLDLLFGGDAEYAAEPEAVDAAGDVVISVLEPVQVVLHARGADAARKLLIIPDDGIAQGGTQIVIPRPGARLFPVTLWIIGKWECRVGCLARFQSDKRIWDFERRTGSETLARAWGVFNGFCPCWADDNERLVAGLRGEERRCRDYQQPRKPDMRHDLIIIPFHEPAAGGALEVDAVEGAVAQGDVPFVARPGGGGPPIAGDAPGSGACEYLPLHAARAEVGW